MINYQPTPTQPTVGARLSNLNFMTVQYMHIGRHSLVGSLLGTNFTFQIFISAHKSEKCNPHTKKITDDDGENLH